jgi:sulfate transport system permease protein
MRRDDAPWWVRHLLILLALSTVGILLVVPLANVLFEALIKGPSAYFLSLRDPLTVRAIALTLEVSFGAVLVNLVFGVAAAWAVTKYSFWGKSLLITLIDLPFSVSPVISGLVYVLLFGTQSALGGWLDARHIQILYAVPGMVLATTFVTFPFVAREVMPVMEAVGTDQEEAALTLGATPWQTFWHVTMPNIKWGVIYGVLLCSARALGEFGAVSVVSGRIIGKTYTLSLRVEQLYQEYQTQSAFAVASLFLVLAVVTLALKSAVEWKLKQSLKEAPQERDPKVTP